MWRRGDGAYRGWGVSTEASVVAHYGNSRIAETILKTVAEMAARRAAETSQRLRVPDLRPFDALHAGGVRASKRLLENLKIAKGTHWLDVGCGVGGVSRHATYRFRCRVTGIDLTPEFCRAAASLTETVGLSKRIAFVQGNALSMPFPDGRFDGAFTVHAGVNIANKQAFYREICRVLKPGATLGIYDMLAGPVGEPLVMPVPWATTPDENFLVSIEETKNLLADAGLTIVEAIDRTIDALAFYKRLRLRAEKGLKAEGLQLAMGAEYQHRIDNARRNVWRNRCGPWEIHCRKA